MESFKQTHDKPFEEWGDVEIVALETVHTYVDSAYTSPTLADSFMRTVGGYFMPREEYLELVDEQS